MRDDEVDDNVTVLNVKEKVTKMFGAHVVKKKGTENEEATRILKDIEKMGCKGKVIIKTDQEPSIVAVAKEIRTSAPTELARMTATGISPLPATV